MCQNTVELGASPTYYKDEQRKFKINKFFVLAGRAIIAIAAVFLIGFIGGPQLFLTIPACTIGFFYYPACYKHFGPQHISKFPAEIEAFKSGHHNVNQMNALECDKFFLRIKRIVESETCTQDTSPTQTVKPTSLTLLNPIEKRQSMKLSSDTLKSNPNTDSQGANSPA